MTGTLRAMVPLIVLPACVLVVSGSQTRPDPRPKQLTELTERLKRETDPGDKARLYGRIGEIHLSFALDQAQAEEYEAMRSSIGSYNRLLDEARSFMFGSAEARKKVKSYRDLEIPLRRQLRQLDELGRMLTFDERDPVTQTMTKVSEIRDELLKALFAP